VQEVLASDGEKLPFQHWWHWIWNEACPVEVFLTIPLYPAGQEAHFAELASLVYFPVAQTMQLVLPASLA
jgi:hypothetical protein